MVKQKKKRNKTYAGAEASLARPVVKRMQATNRNPLQQWWFEKKTIAKPVLITAGIAIVVIWLLIELFRLFSGGNA